MILINTAPKGDEQTELQQKAGEGEPPVDMKKAMNRVGNDMTFYKEMVNEFVNYVPEMIAAERIVRGVESLRIEHKASESGIVIISCGITAFDKKTDLNSKWVSVVDRADKALYRAKSGGRNRAKA